MPTQTDPRVQELLDLAREEGVTLAMPTALILWFEDMGCVVDLRTGIASRPTVGMPTPNAQAVAYLLGAVTQ